MPPTTADTVDANGVRTYYEATGAGAPLVLLHGGFCPIETMRGLIGLLAERYRVWLPERRATGRTPDVDGPITYDVMAEDTIAFMEAVGLRTADVVGWSDGGIVGVLLAMRRPDLVRRLEVIGAQANAEGLRPEARAMMRQETMPAEMLPPMLKDLYAAVSPDGPAHWDAVVAKHWELYRTESTIPLGDLAAIAAPTLIVVAEHDILTPEHAEAMRRAIADARLEVVPGASHGLPMEQPVIVARLVSGFLRQPTPSGRGG